MHLFKNLPRGIFNVEHIAGKMAKVITSRVIMPVMLRGVEMHSWRDQRSVKIIKPISSLFVICINKSE